MWRNRDGRDRQDTEESGQRRWGVKAAPSHAVFVAGRYDLYQDYSRRLHGVLTSFTPLVEGIALDEAFLDVTGGRRLWGSGPD